MPVRFFKGHRLKNKNMFIFQTRDHMKLNLYNRINGEKLDVLSIYKTENELKIIIERNKKVLPKIENNNEADILKLYTDVCSINYCKFFKC